MYPEFAEPRVTRMKSSEQKHLDTVRERFTQTVAAFARTVQSRGRRSRAHGGDGHGRTTRMLRRRPWRWMLACGPATFARAFAPRVARVVGVDFTPAMLAKARRVARPKRGSANIEFVCGDGNALPFADGTFDLRILHLCFSPFARTRASAGRNGARGAQRRPRGDLWTRSCPERADSELNNRIERLRDPSHAAMFSDVRPARDCFERRACA